MAKVWVTYYVIVTDFVTKTRHGEKFHNSKIANASCPSHAIAPTAAILRIFHPRLVKPKLLQLALSLLGVIAFTVVSATLRAASVRPMREAKLLDALKTELEQRAAEDRFSGAVLIAKSGEPIFQAAYGHADRAKKIPNTVDTVFRFGSIGKMFTGVAIMQLVQAGKLKLDDPVARYLPDYPNQEVAAVTIHQLLTHTGGTGNTFGPEFTAHRAELKELKDYIALFGKRGIQFPPGSQWEYSNYGFVLLGRIIEVTSGQTYYDYVREHIFEPAGMTSTDNMPESEQVRGLAIGYTRGGQDGRGPKARKMKGGSNQGSGPLRPADSLRAYRGTSAGGGYSTVGDLLRFVNALNAHRLLDAHHTALVTTGKVATSRPGSKYAYGFEEEILPEGLRRIGHNGSSPGVNGVLTVLPDEEYTIVVLANLDGPAAREVSHFITERLPVNRAAK